jgi:hypothetical protein
MRRFSSALIFAVMPAALSVASASAQSPCNLITPQIATALLGDTVQPGKEMGTLCIFSHTDMEGVMVGVQPVGGMGDTLFNTVIAPNQNAANETVPGLGERAVFQKSHTESDLYILVRGKILSVAVQNSKNANLKGAMIQVAKTIVAHL